MRTAIVGHRGAPAVAPENTMRSFEEAVTLGADHLEFDVRTTKDGHFVVRHDPDLMRKIDSHEISPIATTTLAGLTRSDLGTAFNLHNPRRARPDYAGVTVPTLQEVLDRFAGKVGLFVEVKELGPGRRSLDRFIDTLEATRFGRSTKRLDRVLSFEPELLMKIAFKDPALPLVQSFRGTARITVEQLDVARSYAVGICAWRTKVDQRLIDLCRARRLEIHVYTVNHRGRMKRLVERGVDSIITDHPDRLAAVVQEHTT